MIVLVANEKGGVGKTSVAVNLAALAASDGVRTLLLDTDPNGSTTGWLATRGEVTPPPAEIFTLMLTTNAARMVADQAGHYELVIVDAGAAAWDTLLSVSRQADLVVVPVTPGQFEVDSTNRVFDSLRAMDVKHIRGKVPAYALLNQIPTNAKSKEESELRGFLANDCGIPVLTTVLRNRKAWRECSKAGLGIHEMPASQADAKSAAEIRALYVELAAIAAADAQLTQE
ncbi:MAG: AAA family ATPase [Rhodocyclaceae bacterium]|nr:AAA family ATPase [Rhodocyclaceae bacterium]